MTKGFRIPLFILATASLISGCVPRAQFDQVSADLLQAQADSHALQSELDAIRVEGDALREDLTQAERDADAAREQLAASQAEVASLHASLSEALARARVIEAIFVPSLTGEVFTMSEAEAAGMFLDWTRRVDETNDQGLKDGFDAAVTAGFTAEATAEFLTYTITSLIESLQ